MDNSVLFSTFFLTLLLGVGLFFFIRASVKDRTEQLSVLIEVSPTSVLDQLQHYFEQRAYQLIIADKVKSQIQFQGQVRPSWGLAIFLSFLAAIGFLCLGLVCSLLFPALGYYGLFLVIGAPIAGLFYWKKADRLEKVWVQVQATDKTQDAQRIIITAHRDELKQLEQNLLKQVQNIQVEGV